MAGVAYLLKQRGYRVSGCDKYATPRTEWLERCGIAVAIGHDPSHLADADELVVTPAVPSSEPELSAAVAVQMPIRRRGEVLAALVNATDGIAICGTHGKTTTSVFTAKLLHLLGDDPGWCIGGECGEWPVAAAGTGPLVVEADESDGTLALYHAQTLVVTTMDYDHPEHFKTVEDYRACFAQAEAQSTNVIHAWELNVDDWPGLETLVLGRHNVQNARAAIEVALRRGHTREQIAAVLPQALSALPDRRFQTIWPPLPNSQTHKLTHSPTHKLTNSQTSHLPTIVTDYAHHPAELACAVGMAAALKPTRLRVLFQPHRYSRTKALKDEFPAAFAAADEVVLIPVYPAFEKPVLGGDIADLYVSFRTFQTENGYWPQGLRLARSPEEAWKHVFLTLEPGDLILLAGAGDIINLTPRILSDMGTVPDNMGTVPQIPDTNMGTVPDETGIVPQKVKKELKNLSVFSFYKTGGVTYGGGERFYLGMGSNVWFSDCATDIELVTAPKTLGTVPSPSHLPTSSPSLGTVPSPSSFTFNLSPLTFPAGLPGSQLLPDHPELAFMAGIPGTVGGWTKMNAGAFSDSFGNHLESVFVQDETGGIRKIPAEECGFSYRHSNISGLIVAVVPIQHAGTVPMPSVGDYLAKRKKFPPRTCGSVFKNPSPDRPAGRLLEEAGAKELRVGGAYVWQEHANVIVAGEGATSSDILALARLMAAAVFHRFGIALQPEVCGLNASIAR